MVKNLFHAGLEKLHTQTIRASVLSAGVAITLFANLHYLGRTDTAKEVLQSHEDNPDVALILNQTDLDIHRTNLDNITCEYNPLRALRPSRNAKALSVPLHMDFDDTKFNLGTDDLDPQVFHTYFDSQTQIPVDLMYNRYPFAHCHFLWIPDRKYGRLPQFIDTHSPILDMAYRFSQEKGVHLGYNASGAHSSVNHLHFQGYVPLGTENMAAFDGIQNFTGIGALDELREAITQVHQKAAQGLPVSYNFLMHPNGVAFYERHNQSHEPYLEKLAAVGSGGFAFMECCGGKVLTTKKNVDPVALRGVYQSLKPV
jgi:hypothetical protein